MPYAVGDAAQTVVADNAKRGGILVQAYSPLQGGALASDPDCVAVGKAHSKSGAQVALKWILQHNASFTTSAVPPAPHASAAHRGCGCLLIGADFAASAALWLCCVPQRRCVPQGSAEFFAQDIDLFDFTLSPAEMKKLDGKGHRH
jgi:diketogulonate reductase-like aldo/keto reductase